MNYRIKYNLILISLFFAFVSCEKDLNTKVVISPKLCFNCILNPDSLIHGSLSLSQSISEEKTFVKIDHATIELKKDGQLIGTMQNTGNGIYRLNIKPSSGSFYEISINAEGFPLLHASTTVPEKPPVSYRLDNKEYQDHGLYSFFYTYRVTYTIQDKPGANRYWHYKMRYINSNGFYWLFFDINSTIIDDFNKVTDSSQRYGYYYRDYLRINDIQADGKTLTFTDLSYDKDVVYFMDTDEHYDKYMKSTIKQRINDGDNLLFNEPVQIYTNFENGFGIFGSAAIISFKL